MNKTIFLLTFLVLVLLHSNIFAQQLAQKYLQKLPALPDNICAASYDVVIKWNDRVLALKNEMLTLQADEKQQMEQAQANAQLRMDIFEPANAEKIQKLGEEIQSLETEVNAILTGIASSFIEKQSRVELKYSSLFEQLEQQKKDVQSQRKSTVLIDKKINDAEKEKCEDMSVIHKSYLTAYYKRLDLLIGLGVKGNELSDEMLRMTYVGYTFQTKYGYWLGFLIGYIGELSNIYNDIPICEMKKYNK